MHSRSDEVKTELLQKYPAMLVQAEELSISVQLGDWPRAQKVADLVVEELRAAFDSLVSIGQTMSMALQNGDVVLEVDNLDVLDATAKMLGALPIYREAVATKFWFGAATYIQGLVNLSQMIRDHTRQKMLLALTGDLLIN